MKQKTDYNKLWYYLLIPVVAVVLALLFNVERETMQEITGLTYMLHALAMTSGLWIGCLIIVNYLWRKFPWEQKPVKHLLLEVGLIILYTNAFSFGLYILEVRLGIIEPMQEDLFMGIVITNLITLFITAIHEAAEFYKQWKYNFSKSVRLEKDNIEAKYEMLKTQVNPHFLFNSLNSLVTLVEDNEEAVSYIGNLSEFLRYMLKSRDRQVVLLREEIAILKQYLELQKSRFRDSLIYSIDVDEKYYHYSTPPLVIQMLAENCIKHNVVSTEKPLKISIKADKKTLTVENNLQLKSSNQSTGQGLKNISERYRFFCTDPVKITQNNTSYKVTIPLLEVDL